MDFSLSEDQLAIRETAVSFRKKAIAPRVEEFDKSSMPYPAEWIQTANELGFNSPAHPAYFWRCGGWYFDRGHRARGACGGVCWFCYRSSRNLLRRASDIALR